MVDYKRLISSNRRELLNFKGNLLSIAAAKDVKSIMVTSAMNGEGKTTTALSLAYTLAVNAKDNVYLADGSWNAPKIDKIFNMGEAPGISDYFQGAIGLNSVVRQTQIDNLSIIPFGKKTSSSMEILKPELLKEKIAELRSKCDYVIFDSASIMGSADIAVLSTFFDGVIMVVECEKTKWQVVDLAKSKLEAAGAKIIGAVLNKRKFYIPRWLYG
ncbi:CpsD/CapB family tyrosine-protein kinase [Candidatus Magnetominusculus xianensis]|uniref:non-specific protein-tyrosine kinase n=1 Tax=Candidatus Magnetominusculus xianensis TaxID=1748249 RepID=A0ABR5SDF7_9BACT|nr:CpsD/CapB family tyrosine-protein kinase [Candidatus Magnetominusculus xianensis]KWT82983.1 cobalamin biosynthesis protein CobQ [Candidatus Magnetominusculus xianensis]MBF0403062.1 CpsD/CapB family tyrosine-protein kinase [Nitrospirota bacterium]